MLHALWAAVLSGFYSPLCHQGKSTLAGSTPFRRVPADTMVDPKLADNSFEAKAGSKGAWGEKANKDLKFTKGMWGEKGGSCYHGGGGGDSVRVVQPTHPASIHNPHFDLFPSCTGLSLLSLPPLLPSPSSGKLFRHEKTKKKRGSYRGGPIDTQVYSHKFESD